MNFERAVEVILDFEAGYVNDPNDPGGETKFGISKRTYPDLDIKNLTKEDAKQIYYKDFWDALDLHIMHPSLALVVFDCAVNQGPQTSIKLLQQAIGTKDFGKLNMNDLEAIDALGVKKTLEIYIKKRCLRYHSNKNFKRYGGGWMTRLLDVSVLAYMEVN